MPIQRKRNWDTRELHPFMQQHRAAAFQWGVLDCCLFAANCIEATTGTDIADDFRGKYDDAASAFALIKQLTGGTTVADAAAYCAAKHGLVEWTHKGSPAPLMAKRGDLVVIDNAGQLIAGVVGMDSKTAVSIGESGMVTFPLSKITRAWRV